MKGYLKKTLVTSFIVMLAISVVSCGDNRKIRAQVTPAGTLASAPRQPASLLRRYLCRHCKKLEEL